MCALYKRIWARGYSLMELMVASVGAMAIAVAVVGLSKMSETTMHNEQHIAHADADLRDVATMLRNDFGRAGYMSTPWARVGFDPSFVGTQNESDNDTTAGGLPLVRPPFGVVSVGTTTVCANQVRGTAPYNYAGSGYSESTGTAQASYCTVANYNRLAAVRYFQGGSKAGENPLSLSNVIAPDAVILSGNYATADDYFMRGIDSTTAIQRATVIFDSASGARLYMDKSLTIDGTRYPSATREGDMVSALFLAPNAGATTPASYTGMYRLVDDQGYAQYLYADDTKGVKVNTATAGSPVLQFPASPNGQFSRASASAMGGVSSGLIAVGALFNPVNSFLYQVEALPLGCVAAACTDSYALTKRALRPNGMPAEDSATSAYYPVVLARNVVDFQVAFRVAVGVSAPYTLLDLPFGDAENVVYSNVNTGHQSTDALAVKGPHRIVGVRFLLAVRASEADRTDTIAPVAGSPERARYCMENAIAKCVSGANYARVRSVLMEATLNTAGRFLR